MTPDQRTDALISGMAEAGIEQAGIFVTTGNLETEDGAGGEDRIRAYAAAGHVIANHSHSHSSLNDVSAEDYLADIDRAEAWLADMPNKRAWFRYPYLHEGQDERRDLVRAGLTQRGLMNAYVTIDNYDWSLDSIASDAAQEGRAMDMDALRDLYVETLIDAAEFSDAIAVELLGRSPAHVLLLHETDLNALFITDLAEGLRAAGWEIVPLDEAFADPISEREPDTFYLGGGRVTALAREAGWEPARLVHDRTDEAVLLRLFEERVLQEEKD
jgi:peptidoglycan/xylan/chitin deacetylase (PgdA/CDA1 family)